MAEVPSDSWQPDAGKTNIAGLLGVHDLDSSPVNMSLMGPTKLLLRGFYLNRSEASSGVQGMESFQDVRLKWSEASANGNGGGLSQAGLIAAVVIPVTVAGALLGTLLACLFCRRYHRRHAGEAGGKGMDKPGGGPLLGFLPHACLGRGKARSEHANCSQTGASVVVSINSEMERCSSSEQSATSIELPPLAKQISNTSTASALSRSRSRSAFSADVAQVGVGSGAGWAPSCMGMNRFLLALQCGMSLHPAVCSNGLR